MTHLEQRQLINDRVAVVFGRILALLGVAA
jgi:hypothetical protein